MKYISNDEAKKKGITFFCDCGIMNHKIGACTRYTSEGEDIS